MRKNHPPHDKRININNFAVEYYSDRHHPEVYKMVDLDRKTIYVNTYGDYNGLVTLVPQKWW